MLTIASYDVVWLPCEHETVLSHPFSAISLHHPHLVARADARDPIDSSNPSILFYRLTMVTGRSVSIGASLERHSLGDDTH
jgi:hypothetical protein